jgi:enamine deaminase RidA (YjgF/YER057c/UK114 family)
MSGIVAARLKALGVDLPTPPKPVANYVPVVLAGGLAFVSGQVSIVPGGAATKGKVGGDVDVATAQAAAKVCAINLIAQLAQALDGDLDRVKQVVKLTVFVNAVPDFDQQPIVANGASDFMVEVFGDAGRHARAAVGAGSLPLNVSVEVDGIFEIA